MFKSSEEMKILKFHICDTKQFKSFFMHFWSAWQTKQTLELHCLRIAAVLFEFHRSPFY